MTPKKWAPRTRVRLRDRTGVVVRMDPITRVVCIRWDDDGSADWIPSTYLQENA